MIFKIFRRLFMLWKKGRFKKVGKNVIFDPFSRLSYQTISCGSNIYIGPNAYFSSTHSNITIGNNTIFGPNVCIFGGDHIFDRVGVLLNTIKKDISYKDLDVLIGDEVWVAGNVTILSGVTIGNGAIIGAGSVVTKDIEAYSINVGNPSRKIKMRFTEAELQKHIEIMAE
jgi:acetyltransferase-like isoleucine patch superfamily enzyme